MTGRWDYIIKRVAPHGKPALIAGLADAMPQICAVAELNTPLRQAHFLAQVGHETDGLATMQEYASGREYEGRADLGNVRPGDGVLFKGRGPFQLTGRANYRSIGAQLGVDLIGRPELAERFPVAGLTAALFWKGHGLNRFADQDDIRAVTRRVNGGYNGLASRMAYLKAAKRALAINAVAPSADITANDLRKAGSRTIGGADQVTGGLGGVLAAGSAAAGVASEVGDTVSQVQEAAATAHSAAGALPWIEAHWGLALLLAVTLAGVAFFAWRIWSGAQKVKRARVEDASVEYAAPDLEDTDDPDALQPPDAEA